MILQWRVLAITLSIVVMEGETMSKVMPKCKLCGNEVDKNDTSSFIKKSGRYIHNTCEEQRLAEKDKPKCSFCTKVIENADDLVKRGSLKVHKQCLEQYHNTGEQAKVKTVMRTCPKCGEKVDPLSANALDTDTATYHRECYESIQRAKKNRAELTDYISLKYDIQFPTGYMLKQITDYHEKRGYSYKAMLATLRFIFEVEKIPVKENTGLGLIPFYYEKAKKYYAKLRVAGNSATNITINNKTVKVKAILENKKRTRKSIDLSSL